MVDRKLFIALCALGAAWLPGSALGDPKAVDLADTLDFESFHASDSWSIGIGQDGLVAKRTPAPVVPAAPAPQEAIPERTNTPLAHNSARGDTVHHRISNPYSQRPGARNQSPVDATERLFRNMAETCPQGWQKDREWTTPTADGYLLHYEFHCLDNPS